MSIHQKVPVCLYCCFFVSAVFLLNTLDLLPETGMTQLHSIEKSWGVNNSKGSSIEMWALGSLTWKVHMKHFPHTVLWTQLALFSYVLMKAISIRQRICCNRRRFVVTALFSRFQKRGFLPPAFGMYIQWNSLRYKNQQKTIYKS